MNSGTMSDWMTRKCRIKIVGTQVFRLKAEGGFTILDSGRDESSIGKKRYP